MSEDPLAPKNLGQAFDHIQKTIAHKQAQKNGSAKPKPNRICTICSKVWYHEQVMYSPDLLPKPCPECTKHLDEGMIAIVDVSGRFAFVYSAELVGAEQIQQVSKEVFDKVQEKFNRDNPTAQNN